MPDWFYRTVSRPILFRLPAERARDFALGFMGRLSRLPGGPALIDFLGHMRADERLGRTLLGVTFPAPVGIGPGLDARAVALPALARFGVGFLEVGPVTLAGSTAAAPLVRRSDQEAIWRPDPPASLTLSTTLAALAEARGKGVPLIVRVACASTAPEQAAAEHEHLVPRLAEAADVLALESLSAAVKAGWPVEAWQHHVRRAIALAHTATPGGARRVLLVVPADLDASVLETLVLPAFEEGIAGVLLDGSVSAPPEGPPGRLYGLPVLPRALEQVHRVREEFPAAVIVGAGGVHEPEHALEMLQAGADLVSTDSGLIYTGPGLPKRINESILYARSGDAPEKAERVRPPERAWFWMLLMGLGMLIGSLMALVIASTRVILPYDEAFAGMTRDQLAEVNPRLLAFLTHDRVSLAGTMVTIGIAYVGLAWFGVRRGLHWARQSVLLSAFAGFATFFLFLGYGYLDTFHAFVTAVLFQFLLLALHSPLGPPPIPKAPALVSDRRWLLSQWGQLILIGHAAAVLTAGLVISGVGVTCVFVPEDLAFMHTTAEALKEANPRLLPLIAHDRATFGGMLVSAGLVLLLPALWGFRPSSAWLWWTQLVAVVPAYVAAIAVHLAVGYTDLHHLLPAYGGLLAFLLGEALAYAYLCTPGASEAAWRRFRKGREGVV
jgi:dihydroorotate dehydrogenase